MTHEAFMEELTTQLCCGSNKIPAKQARCDHVPVPEAPLSADITKVASVRSKTCLLCSMDK